MKHAGSPGMALLKDTYDYLVNEKESMRTTRIMNGRKASSETSIPFPTAS